MAVYIERLPEDPLLNHFYRVPINAMRNLAIAMARTDVRLGICNNNLHKPVTLPFKPVTLPLKYVGCGLGRRRLYAGSSKVCHRFEQ